VTSFINNFISNYAHWISFGSVNSKAAVFYQVPYFSVLTSYFILLTLKPGHKANLLNKICIGKHWDTSSKSLYLPRECSLLYKSVGKYHCTINLLKNWFRYGCCYKNKNFLYNPVWPAFWEIDGTWSFPSLL